VYQEFGAHLFHQPLVPVVAKGCAAKAVTPQDWMRRVCEPQHSKFVIPNEARDLLLGLNVEKISAIPAGFAKLSFQGAL